MERRAGLTGAGGFRRLQIQIDHYRILSAADNDGFTRLIRTCIDFLMRHIGRNVNEIAGSGFIAELETLSPAHSGSSPHDIEHGFQFAMMMRPGFCVRLNDNRSGP